MESGPRGAGGQPGLISTSFTVPDGRGRGAVIGFSCDGDCRARNHSLIGRCPSYD